MISQISSVSFLVYTLLCVGRGALTVGVWSKKWGTVRGCKISLSAMPAPIGQKRPNFKIPYFRPSKCRALHGAARGACSLAPLPPSLIRIGTRLTKLGCHIHFPGCRLWRRNSTSSFGFGDIAHLRSFNKYSVSENRCPQYWVLRLDPFIVVGM